MTSDQQRPVASRQAWKYVLVAIGLVVVAVGAFQWFRGVARSVVPTMDFGTTSDMTPVRVWVEDERTAERLELELPKAFLRDRRNWEGGKQAGIWAEFGVRNQEPRAAHPELLRPPEDLAYEIFKRSWKDQLQLNVRSGRIDARRLTDAIRSSGDYVVQPAGIHGLEQFRRRVACEQGGPVSCTDASESIFLLPASSSGALRIRCSNEGRPDLAEQRNCVGDVPFRGWHITFFFRATEISRWKEFSDSALGFLEKYAKTR